MNDLDRLGWADGLAFVTQGLRVGIRVDDSSLLDDVTRHLPPDALPTVPQVVDYLYSLRATPGVTRRGIRHFKLLYFGTQKVARSLQLDDVLAALESHVHDLVATMGKEHIFVADAATVVSHGAAAIFVGGNIRTRMTMVRACVDLGASCYSSLNAVLDLGGRVRPYSLAGSKDDDESRTLRNGAQGVSMSGRPVAVRAMLFAEDETGAAWPPRGLSRGRALVALIEKTPSAHRRPTPVMQALRGAVDQASLLSGDWADPEHVAADVLGRLRHRSAVAVNGNEKP